jgi:hypothetical protein
MTKKDYCDYGTCVALKELGYDGKRSNYCYIEKNKQQLESEAGIFLKVFRGEKNTYVNAIHLYDAQKWLREEKGIIVGIINNFTIQAFDYYVSTWEEDLCRGNKYVSYEEALSEGIKEAVKILKKK